MDSNGALEYFVVCLLRALRQTIRCLRVKSERRGELHDSSLTSEPTLTL